MLPVENTFAGLPPRRTVAGAVIALGVEAR